jgi:beta-galactosidase
MLGYYRALFSTNVPVEFVHINDINKRNYKLLIVPYPLMLSESAAQAIRDFVANGGAVVSEARLAWNDENGKAKDIIPGFGLNQVCNCRETAVQMTPSGKTEITLDNGDKFKGMLYQETLSGNAIAHFADGSPAIVTSPFGKGRMMMIGTFLGSAFDSDREESLGNFIRSLLDWAGVHHPAAAPAGVEIRQMQSGADRIVFAFNHNDTPVDVSLSGVDLETGASVTHKILEPEGVWVVRTK